jgi:CO/xanthine dehydrogenase FAD-binding subunit
VASGATVEVASAARGRRTIDVGDWIVRPKHSAAEPDELIVAVHVPVARGPQQFSKIGTRNAMVIAVANFALVLDRSAKTVRTCIGSAGPTMLRATEAETFIEGAMGEAGAWDGSAVLDDATAQRFGELAAAAARPIDDVRGSADYRRHAVGVMARRTLRWAWKELGA